MLFIFLSGSFYDNFIYELYDLPHLWLTCNLNKNYNLFVAAKKYTIFYVLSSALGRILGEIEIVLLHLILCMVSSFDGIGFGIVIATEKSQDKELFFWLST